MYRNKNNLVIVNYNGIYVDNIIPQISKLLNIKVSDKIKKNYINLLYGPKKYINDII